MNWDVSTDGEGGEVSNWDILAEGEKEADWGSLAEVEFKAEDDEAANDVAEKVALLKGWIDLEGIVRDQDPEGFMAAEQEGEARRAQVEQRKVKLAENEQRRVELEKRREELPREMAEANIALSRHARKERKGIFGGIKKALGIGAAERAELEGNYAKLEEEQRGMWQRGMDIENERRDLEEEIAGTDIDGAKRELMEKYETPLTPEEKKEGLDFDALAELSTDEYLRLWRRLNPFFVTHVTRQGVRDHSAMFYHSAGMSEFQDGMTGILADEKVLRTPAEVHYGLGREVTEQSVEGALGKMLFEDKFQVNVGMMREEGMDDEEIVDALVNGLPVNTTSAAAEPWADKQAVHFAQSLVLDDYYGGESGNEAFFVFPTDVIASQCQFGGHIRDNLTTAQVGSEIKWNDMFVWPKEKDITIDAGLTFLPKSMMVDAETGSKYATKMAEVDGKEVRVPVVDEEAVTKFVEWVTNLKPDDEAVRMAVSRDMNKLHEEGVKAGVSERIMDEIFDTQRGFSYDLERLVNGSELNNLWMVPEGELENLSPEGRRERSVRELLNGEPATWKLAENGVSAEEYWEKYFVEHPEQRPAHIIYYDGDPSEAVVSTLKEAGILEEASRPYGVEAYDEWQRYTGKGDSHERDGDWLGFEENLVRDAAENESLQEPHRRFNEIARRKVAEHYGLKV